MSLLEQLNTDIKTAMKAKDRDTLKVLRLLKATLENEKIAKGGELTGEDDIAVLSREKKQRLESIETFEEVGRSDVAEEKHKEIAIIDTYLPEQLSDKEVKELVQQTIQEVGATSMADMGKVMGKIIPQTKGRADGGTINKYVKEELSR